MDDAIRVLLVDNEPKFCAEMSTYLRVKGFQVETALDGPDALSKVKAARGKFDVAVIDYVMGPPNGTETMIEIRRLYPAIEVLILTAWGDMEPGEGAIRLGAHRYMSKPVAAEELALNVRIAARLSRGQQRRQALEMLVRTGHRAGTACTEDELYTILHEEALKLFPGLTAFLISSFDKQTDVVTFTYAYCRGERLDLPLRKNGNGVTEMVLRNGVPLLLPFGDEAYRQENGLAPPFHKLGLCTSEIAAPMFLEDRVTGAINALSFESDVHYTQDHLQVLQSLANQAAVGIRSVRQRLEAEQLREAMEALAGKRSRDEVVRTIVGEAHRLIDSDFTGLILQHQDGSLVRLSPAIPEDYFDRFEEPRQQDGVTRYVIETCQPRIILDTHADPLVKETVRRAGIQSMLAFPLVYERRALGVLYAHTFEHRYFSQHDVDLWRAFVTQAAAVLWTAMEREREVEDAQRLADELGKFAARLNLEETMSRAATAIKALMKADTCCLAYVDPPTRQITKWAWAEGDAEVIQYEVQPRPDGVTYHILRTMEPLYRPSLEVIESPTPPPELESLGLQSSASLPLVYGTRAIGVVHCNYLKQPQAFDERLRTQFQVLAGRAAVALDGARRERINKIWSSLDRKVATCTELDELYRLFAKHALRAMCADFTVFYPYDPTVPPGVLGLREDEAVHAGALLKEWVPPEGGLRGGVHSEIEKSSDGVLVVNNLGERGGSLKSRLTEREKVKGFVGLRLDVRPSEEAAPRIAGMLFINYREPTAFEPADLVDLQRAGALVAGAIHRLNLRHQIFRQLHAIVEILEAFRQQQYGTVMLQHIAKAVRDALDVDTCTIHEFEEETGKFSWRGAAGLDEPEKAWTMHEDFKRWFLKGRKPIVIKDAAQDKRMQMGEFVTRERIQSAVVYPLYIEAEPVGLLFVSFRYRKEPTPDEQKTIGLFADIAALVLHGAKMRDQLQEMRSREERHVILTTVSMVENTWRHSMVNRAASIRNWTRSLQIRLQRCDQQPSLMEGVAEALSQIDIEAREIADAPPRIPEQWELEEEFIPLDPLIEEVCREARTVATFRAGPGITVERTVNGLEGAQIWGRRRWLIYLMEALLQNARRSMPQGGTIVISAQRIGGWAEIRIQDTGIGVPEDQQKVLFERQIRKETGEPGMGIGGLLARTIVEEHGGKIRLEKPGPGDTTVLIRLPLAQEPCE